MGLWDWVQDGDLKALFDQMRQANAEIARLSRENEELKRQINDLLRHITALEQKD